MIDDNLTWHDFIVNLRNELKKAKLSQIPQLETGHEASPNQTAFQAAFPDKLEENEVYAKQSSMTYGEKLLHQLNINDIQHTSAITKALIISITYNETIVEQDTAKCIKGLASVGFIPKFDDNDANCRILRDEEDETGNPTKKEIIKGLKWLGKNAKAGDVLWLHYSGLSNKSDQYDEGDDIDEAILPLDYKRTGVITDDEIFKRLIADLPKDVTVYAVFDCCSTGSIVDLSYRYDLKKNKFIDNELYPATNVWSTYISN